MNSLLHDFFVIASRDERLGMSHLCIYVALFKCWDDNNFQNPVKIKRSEIMRLSKVNAKSTYHKCMKELHMAKYIIYEPSFHPQGSLVYLENTVNIRCLARFS